MKSTNDPILDAQALCGEQPMSQEALASALTGLGWAPGVAKMAIKAATGIYLEDRDGVLHTRDGHVEELISKTLNGK
jgi:hypothetical protein